MEFFTAGGTMRFLNRTLSCRIGLGQTSEQSGKAHECHYPGKNPAKIGNKTAPQQRLN
jgi:hypothetical protein